MNKLLVLLALAFVGCGQQFKNVEEALAALKTSREMAVSDRNELFKHFDLLEQLATLEVPKKVKIPNSIVCTDYVLSSNELSQIECQDGLFDVCPRDIGQYEEKAQELVSLCESLKEKK